MEVTKAIRFLEILEEANDGHLNNEYARRLPITSKSRSKYQS